MKTILVFFLLLLFILGLAVLYAKGPAVGKDFPLHQIISSSGKNQISPHDTPSALKIVTYNMGYASGKKNNRPVKLTKKEVTDHLDQMIHSLKNLRADVICLQEVDFQSARTFNINQMEYLARGLNFPYSAYVITWNLRYLPWPYGLPNVHYGRMVSGQAVLSQYPIIQQELYRFKKPSYNSFWYNWFYLNRIAQKLTLQLGKETARIWNIHLEAFDQATRIDQANRIANEVLKDTIPLQWVAGDFNSVSFRVGDRPYEDQGEALKLFLQKTLFKNAENQNPFFTMPSWNPQRKIDHLTYREGIDLKEVGFLELQASDHLPVWAMFERNPLNP